MLILPSLLDFSPLCIFTFITFLHCAFSHVYQIVSASDASSLFLIRLFSTVHFHIYSNTLFQLEMLQIIRLFSTVYFHMYVSAWDASPASEYGGNRHSWQPRWGHCSLPGLFITEMRIIWALNYNHNVNEHSWLTLIRALNYDHSDDINILDSWCNFTISRFTILT